jgi:DNA processing protein
VLDGTHPDDPDGRSHSEATSDLPHELARRCHHAGVEVAVFGSDHYPQRLLADAEPPAVLFVRGDPYCGTGRPAVAVVGTRSATAAGREAAFEIGRALAEAGIVVVSGLAPGIDLAALSGALSSEGAPGVAVLGAAHDDLVRHEQRHVADRLAESGAVLSELPPGVSSARWRFAVRNRILVGLADLVVVVECHAQGGALHTVEYARRRAVPIAALPGSTSSSASEGTNALLVEGAACVRRGDDVVALLEHVTGRRATERSRTPRRLPGPTQEPTLDDPAVRVLDAVGADPITLQGVVLRSGVSLSAAALALEQLSERGAVRGEGGFWWRHAPAGSPGRRRGRNG